MAIAPVVDAEKVEAFVGKILNDSSAALVTTLAALGDRLGLFKTLATGGPATSAELAARAEIASTSTVRRAWRGTAGRWAPCFTASVFSTA